MNRDANSYREKNKEMDKSMSSKRKGTARGGKREKNSARRRRSAHERNRD